jgi:hypothetical protein
MGLGKLAVVAALGAYAAVTEDSLHRTDVARIRHLVQGVVGDAYGSTVFVDLEQRGFKGGAAAVIIDRRALNSSYGSEADQGNHFQDVQAQRQAIADVLTEHGYVGYTTWGHPVSSTVHAIARSKGK